MVQGRYSFVGAQPAMEVVARENTVTVIDHHTRQRTVTEESDPMEVRATAPVTWTPCSVCSCAVGHQSETGKLPRQLCELCGNDSLKTVLGA